MGLTESSSAQTSPSGTGRVSGTAGRVKRQFSRELFRSTSHQDRTLPPPSVLNEKGALQRISAIRNKEDNALKCEKTVPVRDVKDKCYQQISKDASTSTIENEAVSIENLNKQDCSSTCHPECRGEALLPVNERTQTSSEDMQSSSNDTLEAQTSKMDSRDDETSGSPPESSPVPTETALIVPTLDDESLQNDVVPETTRHVSTGRYKTWSGRGSADLAETQAFFEEELQAQLRKPGFKITSGDDGNGSYQGLIRVHMNLWRPISVVAGTRPPSIYDILKEDQTTELQRTLTSFYLPRDTVKALHITNSTTTSEVIVALLRKFRVIDNPRKFALYERYFEQEGDNPQVIMRRIADDEKPLALALKWSKEPDCNKMFVLQENDTGDILWEAFTVPELNNFLRILDREEEEYRLMVVEKYKFMALKIQEAIKNLQASEEGGALLDAAAGATTSLSVEPETKSN